MKKGIVHKVLEKKEGTKENSAKKNLLKYLKDMKTLEGKLWGVTIKHISHEEEVVLENANHLVHYFNNKSEKSVRHFLENKSVKEFVIELQKLRDDFKYLRKQILMKNKLKNLIAAFSIKLVERENYSKLEDIFLLEKQLYDVISKQEDEFSILIKDIKKLSFEFKHEKYNVFYDTLVRLREVLAGHMDHHDLWEEEMAGYSNTCNIINALIKEVNSVV